jgi:regulator of sirC expression with transglutaminase-like and TPR domain
VLEPLDWTLRRERGQALAALGQTALAIEDLALYLQHAGAAPDRARVSAQLAALRDAGPPRWH